VFVARIAADGEGDVKMGGIMAAPRRPRPKGANSGVSSSNRRRGDRETSFVVDDENSDDGEDEFRASEGDDDEDNE
jgi:hypothetical protein